MPATALLAARPFQPAPFPAAETGRARSPLFTPAALILACLMEEPTITIRELARRSGRTERAVWNGVRRLEQEGLLRRRRIGRRNTYQVDADAVARRLREEGRTLLRLSVMAA